jgi:hypothetical protein
MGALRSIFVDQRQIKKVREFDIEQGEHRKFHCRERLRTLNVIDSLYLSFILSLSLSLSLSLFLSLLSLSLSPLPLLLLSLSLSLFLYPLSLSFSPLSVSIS